MERFYLGTHQPGWLNWSDVPLFVSDRRLRGYKTLPVATASWALDSGGFTELSTFGSWEQGPSSREYAERVRRYQRLVGKLEWAAPQDWMCEPFILAKTGLTVREHQRRTIASVVELRDLAPEIAFVPVLQGFAIDEYLHHIDLYRAAGIDLAGEPLVGVGSVCRRQGTDEIRHLFEELHDCGLLNLHGFGLKTQGLMKSANLLTSADSMAWSYDGRRKPPLADCIGHRNCANCPRFALAWRAAMLRRVDEAAGVVKHTQMDLLRHANRQMQEAS